MSETAPQYETPNGFDWVWQETAACWGENPELFHAPDHDEPAADQAARETAAKQICAPCPARTECLEEAFTLGDWHGVRGGLNAAERVSEWRRRTRPRFSAREVACGHCSARGAFAGYGPGRMELIRACHHRWVRAGRPDRVPDAPVSPQERKRARKEKAVALADQGLKYREVAGQLGVSVNHAALLVREARRERGGAA